MAKKQADSGKGYNGEPLVLTVADILKKSDGRAIGEEEYVAIGGSCSSAEETREKEDATGNGPARFNGIINFISDDYHDDVYDIKIYPRRGNQEGVLVSFAVGETSHHAFVDYSQQPYKVDFDGPIYDDDGNPSTEFILLPLAAKFMSDSPEFREAFETMRRSNASIEDRIHAAGVACDAFDILAENYAREINVTYDELTPEMAERYIERGEFTVEGAEDDKDTFEYDAAKGFDMDAAMMGAYRRELKFPDDITDEEKSLIMSKVPSLSVLDGYVPIDDFDLLFGVVLDQLSAADELDAQVEAGAMTREEADIRMRRSMENLLLQGKPGAGKSSTVEAVAAALGLPFWQTQFTHGSEDDKVEGGTRIVEGNIEFDPSPIIQGWKYGGLVCIDEVNLAQQGMLQGTLGAALEAPYEIAEGGGSHHIRRRNDTVVFGTMNIGLQGTRLMNEAVDSRFGIHVNVNEMSKESFMEALCHRTGVDESQAAYIYNAYTSVQKFLEKNYEESDALNRVTFRGAMEAGKLMKSRHVKLPRKDAIKHTMLAQLDQLEIGLADKVYDALEKNLG